MKYFVLAKICLYYFYVQSVNLLSCKFAVKNAGNTVSALIINSLKTLLCFNSAENVKISNRYL